MKSKCKIILVDDHDFYRKTLKKLLKEVQHFEVVAEAANGIEFLEILSTKVADIILMDIKMPEMDGITATKIAIDRFRDVKIIALTMYKEKEYFLQMMQYGAKGFILKDTNSKEIETAVEAVLNGKNYYPKGLATSLLVQEG